jgi:hypothetical protein
LPSAVSLLVAFGIGTPACLPAPAARSLAVDHALLILALGAPRRACRARRRPSKTLCVLRFSVFLLTSVDTPLPR